VLLPCIERSGGYAKMMFGDEGVGSEGPSVHAVASECDTVDNETV